MIPNKRKTNKRVFKLILTAAFLFVFLFSGNQTVASVSLDNIPVVSDVADQIQSSSQNLVASVRDFFVNLFNMRKENQEQGQAVPVNNIQSETENSQPEDSGQNNLLEDFQLRISKLESQIQNLNIPPSRETIRETVREVIVNNINQESLANIYQSIDSYNSQIADLRAEINRRPTGLIGGTSSVQPVSYAPNEMTFVPGGSINSLSWAGSIISPAYGGTGQNFTGIATGTILYASSVGTIGQLAAGTSTWMLASNGADSLPTWTSTTTLLSNLGIGSGYVTYADASTTAWDTAFYQTNASSTSWSLAAGIANILNASSTDWSLTSGLLNASSTDWSYGGTTRVASNTAYSLASGIVNASSTSWSQAAGIANVLNASSTSWSQTAGIVSASSTSWSQAAGIANILNASSTSWSQAAGIVTASSTEWSSKQPYNTRLTVIGGLATTTANLIVGNGGPNGWSAFPAGGDGECLVASSSQSLGVTWTTCSGGGGGGVTSLNVLTGAVTITGSSTLSVTSGGGVIAISQPQDLGMGASPTFANLTVSGTLTYASTTNWDNAAYQVNASSSKWSYGADRVIASSTDWSYGEATRVASNTAYSLATNQLNASSTDWSYGGTTRVASNTAYSFASGIVNASSTSWSQAAGIINASSTNWNWAFGLVNASSTKWDIAYYQTNASSTSWNLAAGIVNASSTDWSYGDATRVASTTAWTLATNQLNASSTDWSYGGTTRVASNTAYSLTSGIVSASSTSWSQAAGIANTLNASSTSWSQAAGIVNVGSWRGNVIGISYGGTGTSTNFTSGSIVFSDGTTYSQNNANLFWDNANTRLGVGTTTPAYTVDIYGTLRAATSSFGQITAAGNVLPATTTAYNLGSSDYKWGNIYAATATIGNTITINSNTISGSVTTTISTANGPILINPATHLNIADTFYVFDVLEGDYFSKTRIDWAGTKGANSSVAAPSADTIYISYYDGTDYDLEFAKSTDGGTSWSTSTIDPYGSVGSVSSIVAFSTSTIYVGYTGSTVMFAKSTDGGTSWTTTSVSATYSFGSMTAPSTSTIYMTYYYVYCAYEACGGSWRFSKSTDGGATWTEKTLSSNYYSGSQSSIVAPSTSTIYVSFYESTGLNLKFHSSTDGGVTWSATSTIDWTGSIGGDSHVASPLAGTVYISYYDATLQDLRFAKSTNGGTSWTTTTIDYDNAGSNSSIVALSTSTIYISYYDDATTTVNLAKSTDGGVSWTTSVIDPYGTSGTQSSIAAPSTGTICVSYYDGSNGDLRFAKNNLSARNVTIGSTAQTDFKLGLFGLGAASEGWITADLDIAENYPTYDLSIEAGDVIAVDPGGQSFIVKSDKPYQDSTIGIISTKPGFAMTGDMEFLTSGNISKENERLVALAGRVPVKVSSKNGEIKAGDVLTSSDIPGVAMKATDPGMVVGTALENYNEEGIGKIMAFVNAHWSIGNLVDLSVVATNTTSTISTTTESILDSFTLAIKKSLEKLGLIVKDGVARLKEVFAEKIRIGSLEMIDKATGEIYCSWIENGEWVKVKGECESSQETVSTSTEATTTESDVSFDVSQSETQPEEILVGDNSTSTEESQETEVIIDDSQESTTTEDVSTTTEDILTTTEEISTSTEEVSTGTEPEIIEVETQQTEGEPVQEEPVLEEEPPEEEIVQIEEPLSDSTSSQE